MMICLASGASIQATADTVGCATKTVRRRLSNPTFVRALDQARGRLFERALGRAAHHAIRAAETLAEIMESKESPPRVRVAAAKTLLDTAVRFREVEELSRRISVVEAAVAAGSGRTVN